MLGNGLPRLRDEAERDWPAAAGSGRQARKRSVPTRAAGHAERGRLGRPGRVLFHVGAGLKLLDGVHGENVPPLHDPPGSIQQ